jgi:Protein of unknown function (DUF2958)
MEDLELSIDRLEVKFTAMESTGSTPVKLLPRAVRVQIPPISKEREDDPMVWVKLFTPLSDWYWYVLQGSAYKRGPHRGDYLMYGWVVGDSQKEGFPKEGFFRLRELESVGFRFRTTIGQDTFFSKVLPGAVARDGLFRPTRLSVVQAQHAR